MTEYCPHCQCDEDNGEHGPNCPRYHGPVPGALDESRLDEIEERLDAIEAKLEAPTVEFDVDTARSLLAKLRKTLSFADPKSGLPCASFMYDEARLVEAALAFTIETIKP